jgi:hypothetical protein
LLQLIVVVLAPSSVLEAYLIKAFPVTALTRAVWPAPTDNVPLCTMTRPSSTRSLTADDTSTVGVVSEPDALAEVPIAVD